MARMHLTAHARVRKISGQSSHKSELLVWLGAAQHLEKLRQKHADMQHSVLLSQSPDHSSPWDPKKSSGFKRRSHQSNKDVICTQAWYQLQSTKCCAALLLLLPT